MTDVFDAVADPIRRRILELLQSGAVLSLTELSEPLPISRQAVTKHLDILENAGLVEQERVGRERLHRLRPMPLRELDEWLAPYAAAWDRCLARVESHLREDNDGKGDNEKTQV